MLIYSSGSNLGDVCSYPYRPICNRQFFGCEMDEITMDYHTIHLLYKPVSSASVK